MTERYGNYGQLRENEKEGEDYQIRFRRGISGILVMAPHGGGIEPGTTEMADAVAGDEHSFYSFEGLKRRRNLSLHITSRRFDEPVGMRMAKDSETILAIHGCSGKERVIYIGGRDGVLRDKARTALEKGGFSVREDPRFPGRSPLNICNRSRSGQGVQLEVTISLRRLMFRHLSRIKRKHTTILFEKFVMALKTALSESCVWAGPSAREGISEGT